MKLRPSQAANRKRDIRPAEGPAPLRLPGLFAILAVAAASTALGVTIVQARFEARDLDLETRRVQELTRERRDNIRQIESQIGELKRGASLREAALGPLGMLEPEPAVVGRVELDSTRVQGYSAASKKIRKQLEDDRAERESWKKEGF